MKQIIETKTLKIAGMTCISCQNKIERELRNTPGVQKVRVSYSKGTADIIYDKNIISIKDVTIIIENLGYDVVSSKKEPRISWVISTLAVIVLLYVFLERFGILNLLVPSQLADTKMGYGMLFVIGLITSIHCIAMCGGINLSQCIPRADMPAVEKQSKIAAFVPAFLYNLGRIISYTFAGFILGFAGLIFGGGSDVGLSVMTQGILKLIAGVFMVAMGVNMLGIFPWFRKLQSRMAQVFARKVNIDKIKSKSPLIVGLLNGLMPCGPLQSMQIVALVSGNPFTGALSMFLFSLGTVPLMLGLGSIVSVLGKRFTQKAMNVGAVLITVLGLAMLSQGGALSGLLSPNILLVSTIVLCAIGIISIIPLQKPSHKAVALVTTFGLMVVILSALNSGGTGNTAIDGVNMVGGTQVINSTLSYGSYPHITVQAGIPVKWIIDAPQGSINGCNNRINIQEYNIKNYSFKTGENVIEFTPTKTGRFQYSCWMGMIRGSITVMEADTAVPETNSK